MKKIFKIMLPIVISVSLVATPSIILGLNYVNQLRKENNNQLGPDGNNKPTNPDENNKPIIPDKNPGGGNGEQKPTIPDQNQTNNDVPTYQKAYFKDDIDDYVPPKPGIGVDANNNRDPLIDGKIPNNNYKYIWDRSVRIGLRNRSTSSHGNEEAPGTGWYLDFIKEENENYPLTWFMGTNLHVAATLKNKKDYQDVRKVETFKDETLKFIIELDTLTNNGKETDEFQPHELNTLPKTIFLAADFLEKKPNDMFNNPSNYNPSNLEEMKDFAVLEIKFDNEDQARKLTKNLYETYKTEKLNFAKQTFYSLYERSEISKLNDIYIGGYPWSSRKFTINKIQSELSKDPSLGAILSDRRKESLRNIKNRELVGISDNFSNFNFHFEIDGVSYKRIGLTYEPEFSDMEPGASGSMSINKNKEIIGIFWGKEQMTRVGMIDPLISEGFSLNGQLVYPKYDLINGNVKGQTKSWKDSMKKHHKGKTSNYFGLL